MHRHCSLSGLLLQSSASGSAEASCSVIAGLRGSRHRIAHRRHTWDTEAPQSRTLKLLRFISVSCSFSFCAPPRKELVSKGSAKVFLESTAVTVLITRLFAEDRWPGSLKHWSPVRCNCSSVTEAPVCRVSTCPNVSKKTVKWPGERRRGGARCFSELLPFVLFC